MPVELLQFENEQWKLLLGARGALTATSRSSLQWGTYWPDSTTTGLDPAKGFTTATLPPYTGSYTVTSPGTVIENVRLDDYLLIRAANVTVRNCWGRGPATASSTQTAIINANHSACSNLLIEDCLLQPRAQGVYVDTLVGHDYTIRRSELMWGVDGMGVFNSSSPSAAVNVLIEQNYVHDLAYFSPDPNHPDNRTHNDCIQIQGNSGITIRGNTLDAFASTTVGNGYPGASPAPVASDPYYPSVTGQAIGVTPNVSAVTGLTITANRLRAGAQSLTIIKGNTGSAATTAIVTNNVFDPSTNPLISKSGVSARRAILADPTLNIPTLAANGQPDFSGNVDLNGAPVTIYRLAS